MAREVAESQAQHGKNQPDPHNAWTAAVAQLGLLDRQEPERVAYLWPDNVRAWSCWQGVQTQWRVGMSGPTGLDYAAVYPLLDRKATDPEEWEQLFYDLRVMESAALEAIAESREHD